MAPSDARQSSASECLSQPTLVVRQQGRSLAFMINGQWPPANSNARQKASQVLNKFSRADGRPVLAPNRVLRQRVSLCQLLVQTHAMAGRFIDVRVTALDDWRSGKHLLGGTRIVIMAMTIGYSINVKAAGGGRTCYFGCSTLVLARRAHFTTRRWPG